MDEFGDEYSPVILVILDGWGIAPNGPGNAISQAHIPNFNSFLSSYPHGQLQASGSAVGLPEGSAGNSEVGHLNIGAGRIVYQEVQRINLAIADGTFLTNEALKTVCAHIKKNNSKLHLMGLVGLGVVHASIEHLYSLLWLAKEEGIKEVYLHLFTDGRDSPPNSALQQISQLQERINHIGVGQIASVMGRYYSMDRDNRWDRIETAYNTLVLGSGNEGKSAAEIIENSYKNLISDEFIVPSVVDIGQGAIGKISDNDGIVSFNFRGDRARELTKAFILPTFSDFNRQKVLKNICFVTMTQYEKGLPALVAFQPTEIPMPLARIVSERGKRQLHISETEKYAHVTYFLNGGREDPFSGEDRIHIPSVKVKTYDLKPEMSAYEITDVTVARLQDRIYDLIVINYANADMVAHSGKMQPTIKAVEVVDECLGKLVRNLLAMDGTLIITGDHGNAEEMLSAQGGAETEHSTNPVPFMVIKQKFMSSAPQILLSGILADVAPTILALMGIPKPYFMTGRNLINIRQ